MSPKESSYYQEDPPIVIGTPYGTKVQRGAIERENDRDLAALRAKAAQRVIDLAEPGAVEALMQPDGPDAAHIEWVQARRAMRHDLVDLKPPQQYNGNRSD